MIGYHQPNVSTNQCVHIIAVIEQCNRTVDMSRLCNWTACVMFAHCCCTFCRVNCCCRFFYEKHTTNV